MSSSLTVSYAAMRHVQRVRQNDAKVTSIEFRVGNFVSKPQLLLLASALCDNTVVQSLTMSWVQVFDDDCAIRYANTLRKNTALQSVSLETCRSVGDAGISALIAAWCDTDRLCKLSIERIKVSAPALRMLADGLGSSKRIRMLVLNNCSLDAELCLVLARALKRNRSLERLFFYDGAFSVASARALLDAMHGNYSLIRIDYSLDWLPPCYHHEAVRAQLYATVDANRVASLVYDADRTPALGDGLMPSGDFDALPNEIMCRVACRLWPSEAALIVSQVCRRWRDVVQGNHVIQHRMGRDADGCYQFGHRRLFYRAVYLESILD
jgi:hypothetical protein